MSTLITDNVGQFTTALRERLDQQVQLIAKQAAVAVLKVLGEQLFLHTPVLTGQARNNWQPSVDTPATEEITGGTGVAQTGTGTPMTAEEQGRLEQVAQQFMSSSSAKLYISNLLDYIAALDAGSSVKAPEGIVDISVQLALEVLQRDGIQVTIV